MVKSSTKSTSKKSSAEKSHGKTAKSSVKSTGAVSSSAKKCEKVAPFSPIFGAILVVVGAIMISFIIALFALDLFDMVSRSARKSDAAQIATEYTTLDETNLFVYKSQEEILNILDNGTGIVFFGFPSCPWCQYYVHKLDTVAKEYSLTEIYYYDIKSDREQETDFYRAVVDRLSDYLQYDNVGNKRIYVPNAVFLKDGEIILNDWETSKDTLGLETPEEYWTEERIEAWYEKVRPALETLKTACGSVCNA